MSRKVTIELTIKVIATLDDDLTVDDFVNDLDYAIQYEHTLPMSSHRGTVEDTEILDFEVTDSK